jgi:hypothetical protein
MTAIPPYSKENYETCITETCSRMHSGKGIPTTAKIITGIQTQVPLEHKQAHDICKEFPALLP